MAQHVFVTGATGFIGRRLIPALLAGGHRVRALARHESERRVPAGCEPVTGDPLNGESYRARIAPATTFVHLVGVAHPSPAKAREFRSIDLASTQEAVPAARTAGIKHFVYLSVAQPSPVMRAYVQARAEAEALVRASGLDATFVRPFYVLGPGRRWPYLVAPLYWLFERLPSKRETARRLGLVTIDQMIQTLAYAVEHPASGVRIFDVDSIKRGGLDASR